MAAKIRHRGPDDEGFVFFPHDSGPVPARGDDTYSDGSPYRHVRELEDLDTRIALGHRRLSILDLSFKGHQPMCYRDRYWIVYNGEVYNYVELRAELETHGYEFTSATDTEVILAAYDHWGRECASKLNGMWAFVIYDTLEDSIFMCRDRFGIKPLYYYMDDEVFIFASEIKAILEYGIPRIPNLEYCRRYLREGPLEYTRETAFEGVKRFPPAHSAVMKTGELGRSGLMLERFWDFTPCETVEAFNEEKAREYAREYADLLRDSVRIRLRADVKIGSALSGGLDSSSITHLINSVLAEQGATALQETFSSVYKTEGALHCDESAFVDELAAFLNVNSNQIEPRVDEIPEEHRKVVYAFDHPPHLLNMAGWYTFKRIGMSDVTINLDGQGADEQCAGYFRYVWRHLANLPAREAFREGRSFARLPGIQRKILILSLLMNLGAKLLGRSTLDRLFTLLGCNRAKGVLRSVNAESRDDVSRNLVNLFHYGDRQSMAHSIESRVPFMDYRLVQFLASLPSVYKIHGGWTKLLQRIAFDKKLPDRITWRRDKMGWPDPTEHWVLGPLREWVCTTVEKSPLLAQLGMGRNVRKLLSSERGVVPAVRLLNLAVWHDIFFGEGDEPQLP